MPLNSESQNSFNWQFIWKIALDHKAKLLAGNLIALLATIFTVPVPLLMPLLVDEVLLNHGGKVVDVVNSYLPIEYQHPINYLLIILITSLFLRLIGLVLNVIQTRQFSKIAKDVVFRIRTRILNQLETVSMKEYEAIGSGSIIGYLVTDLDTIDNFIGNTISKLLVAACTVFGTAIILLWMDWELGLFIIFLNPIVIYLAKYVGSKIKELKIRENAAYASFQESLAETLEAIYQLRACNREHFYFSALVNKSEVVKSHSIEFAWQSDAAQRLSFLTFLVGFDIFRATAMLMVIYSDLTIGEMLAVFGYLWFMMAPVQEILGIQQGYYAANGALSRINKISGLTAEPHFETVNNPFIGKHSVSISVRNLWFKYQSDPILKGINLDIRAGEKIAIVGASGGGKSTLAQTLVGLYAPMDGMIYYDDTPMSDIGLSTVREHVATVLQHPILLNTSIRENLTLGRSATDSELWRALDIAQLKTIVENMSDGLDTQVGRHGIRLSGGQKQRLAIARMIISKPSVVILDEATSALDTETELKLHLALNSFLAERTTIIIAHRLSAVRQADHVYVFEEGVVCEHGSHEQLINQQGLYSKLYKDYQ